MSVYQFIAADYEISELDNSNKRIISVQEAIDWNYGQYGLMIDNTLDLLFAIMKRSLYII